MTNKSFFIDILKREAPLFKKAINALPEEKHGHKVHERSRQAGDLAGQLAIQWKAISGIVTTGRPTFNPHEIEGMKKADMLKALDEGVAQLQKDLETISDEEWENGKAGWGEALNDKKYQMSWFFMLDAIHHRAQLLTFLRAMGEKVPSIYGPSADEQ